MAFDKKPSTWLGAGYASSSGSHTVTFNTNDAASNKTLTQLTDANADPDTGDIRIVGFALLQALYAAALAQSANLPTKMTITRSVQAQTGGNIKYSYNMSFVVSASSYSVASE